MSRRTPQPGTPQPGTPQPRTPAEREHPSETDLKSYRSISIPVLVGTLVVLAAGGTGLYFWHAYQTRRGAAALLTQAEELIKNAEDQEAKSAYSDAANLIYRYTQMQPDDTDAQIRLAEVYEKSTTNARSAERGTALLYEALGLADVAKQDELRRTLIKLLLKQGQYLEAEVQSRKLASPDGRGGQDFEAARLRALALFGRYQSGDISAADVAGVTTSLIAELRRAIALQSDPQLVEMLAFLLHSDDPRLVIYPPPRTDGSEQARDPSKNAEEPAAAPTPLTKESREAEADQVMDQLVQQRSDNALAWLVRFNHRKQRGLPGSEEDLDQALRLGGDDLQVRLTAASNAHAAARTILEKNNLKVLPSLTDDQAALSPEQKTAVDAARAKLQTAVEHYQYVLDQIEPKNENALLGLGRAVIALNEQEKAIEVWSRALDEPDTKSLAIRYYLTQLFINRQEFAAASPHVAVLDKEIEKLNLRADRNQFEPLKHSVELMKAKVLIGEKKFADALPLLQRTSAGQPTSEVDTAEHFQAYRLAGLCHEQAGRPDIAAHSLESAAEVAVGREDQAAMLLSAAAAWEVAGATANAINDCQRAVKLLPDPEAFLLLARLLLTKQQMLPQGEQDWSGFNETLEKIRQADSAAELKAGWRRDLLEADAKLVQAVGAQQSTEAMENIYQSARKAQERYPDDESLMGKLVFLYQRLQKPDDADVALKRFQSLTTDEIARHVLEANLQYERKQLPAARASLDQIGPNLSPADRVLVEKIRAQIVAAEGNPKEAADILKKLATDHPGDLTIARLRMQVVDQMQDSQAKKELETELLGGGQEDKSWALAMKIQRLVSEAASERDAGFMEAVDLLGRLETARPDWSVVYSLRGEAEEKRASWTDQTEDQRVILDQAARAYERAVELGDRTVGVHERLVNTLYRAGRFQDATVYLARIDNAVPLSSSLSEVAINIALQDEKQEQALEVARRAFQGRPNDVMARVWYGLVLLGARQLDKAEQMLLDAVKAAPQDDRSWNGLFTFYVRTDNKVKARETLMQMMKQADMSKGRRAFVLAQGYEALGDNGDAETAYREAMKESPDDARIRRRLAQFFVSRMAEPNSANQEKAIAELQEIVRRDPNDGRTKRTLATLLASEGGEQWKSAVEMLGAASSDQPTPATDRRLQGILLFQRDGAENLAQARKIFEALAESTESEPNDRLLLARILERQGDVPAARSHFARLAPLTPPNLRALIFYIDFLIRHGELDEAQRWLQVVVETRKAAFDLGVLELQARLLIARGSSAQVPDIIDPPSLQQLASLENGDVAKKTKFLGDVGSTYARLELYAPAETWYRRLMELDPKQYAALATCLARQGRMREALDICEGAVARLDAAAVSQVLANVLTAGNPSPADYERAEPILIAAEQKAGDDANVLFRISNVRIVQGKLDDAIRLLEKTVKLDPKNVLALNNLAVIMSEQPGLRAKAIEYIDRAIDITGPRPDLNDTKGSIYLYDNQPDKAVELLEFAVRTVTKDPRFQFHLAAAYFGINKMDEAAKYFREAMQAGLESQVLTQADRKLIADMQGLLKTPISAPITVPNR